MEENQTSSEEEIISEEPEETEPQTEEETEEETEGGEETASEEEPEEDYKKKFSESSREANRLLSETKNLKAENEKLKGMTSQLKEEQTKYFDALKDENPEAYEVAQLKKSVDDIKKSVLLQKESLDVSNFVKENPKAGSVKEALKKLSRIEPSKSIDEIYQENFAPAFETVEEKTKEKIRKEKKNQPETGQSISKNPIAKIGKDFNKLSLEERKKAFKKMGL